MISCFFHYFSLRSKPAAPVIGTAEMEASLQEAGGEHRRSYPRGDRSVMEVAKDAVSVLG